MSHYNTERLFASRSTSTTLPASAGFTGIPADRKGPPSAPNGTDPTPRTLSPQGAPLTVAEALAPRMPGTAIDAALLIMDVWIAAGLRPRLQPLHKGGAPMKDWTLDRAATSRDDILRDRKTWRRAAGVGAVDCGLVDIEVDDPTAEPIAAKLAGDAVTFEIQSRRGRHRVFLRGDAAPANYRAGHVHDDRHPCRAAEILAPKLDAVFGLVRVFMPGKVWLTHPAQLAPMPLAMHAAVAGIVKARQQREADTQAAIAERAAEALAQRQARPQTAGRDLRPYADAMLAGIAGDAGELPNGQRGLALYGLAYRAGRLVGASWSGIAEAAAEAALMVGAERCGYVQSNGYRAALRHVQRGLSAGMDAPLPEPADRDLVRATLPPDRLREIERRAAWAAADVFGQVRAFNATLPPKVKGKPRDFRYIYAGRAAICARLAAELAQRAIDQGRLEIIAGMADLGLAIDASPATISRAMLVMRALGWTIQPGKLGDKERARATAWRLPPAPPDPYLQDATLCRRTDASAGAAPNNALVKPHCSLERSRPGALVRGLRRGLPGMACELLSAPDRRATAATRREIGALSGCGSVAYRLLPVLAAAAGPLTVAELAELSGASNPSARRCCHALAARGLVLVDKARTAGRTATAYRLTAETGAAAAGELAADPSPMLAKTIEIGERSILRAVARIEAERTLLTDAREIAQALGVHPAAALAEIRERAKRIGKAERDPDLSMAHIPRIAEARRAERRDTMNATRAYIARLDDAAARATAYMMGALAPAT